MKEPIDQSQAQQGQPLKGVKILLVEDELDVAYLLMFIFNDAGADVYWTVQASDALAYLKYFHPSILVCDIKLPDYDGDVLMQEIRQSETQTSNHLPALAITSYTREFAEERILASGFDCFLPKHFDIEQLVSTVLNLV